MKMPKGWKKGLGQPDVIEWENIYNPVTIVINSRRFGNVYEVALLKFGIPWTRERLKTFEKKSDAMRFANIWMQKHPKG